MENYQEDSNQLKTDEKEEVDLAGKPMRIEYNQATKRQSFCVGSLNWPFNIYGQSTNLIT